MKEYGVTAVTECEQTPEKKITYKFKIREKTIRDIIKGIDVKNYIEESIQKIDIDIVPTSKTGSLGDN